MSFSDCCHGSVILHQCIRVVLYKQSLPTNLCMATSMSVGVVCVATHGDDDTIGDGDKDAGGVCVPTESRLR